MGGGMRQAGIIAAGALYALTNNVERLKIDHNNAKEIANILINHPLINNIYPTSTNILIAQTKKENGASEMVEWLKERGVLCFPFGPDKIRLVFHLGIDDEKIYQLKSVFQ